MTEMPSWMMYTVGSLIVANIGTILAVAWGVTKLVAKASWFVAKLDSRIEKNEKDVAAAHEKIRFNRQLILKNGGIDGAADS